MKRQLVIISAISVFFGMSVGYFISLASSFKKSSEAVAAMPSVLAKIDDYSEMNVAVMLRMFQLSERGKPSHSDKVVLWFLARYYNQRSSLSEAEQTALSAGANLKNIDKIAESDELLRKAIQAVRDGKPLSSALDTPL